MTERLDFERHGRDWPNRESSQFFRAAGLRWHVQRMGAGPTLLLLHGTGASTHSWRAFAPILASRFDVVAPDLPGHGFTDTPPQHRLSLAGMSEAVAILLRELGVMPVIAIGHSAGAAILIRMCLEKRIAPQLLVSLNGALLPFGGLAGRIFSPLARVLAGSKTVPRWFARRASDPKVVGRLLHGTGSVLEPKGAELYGRLAQNPVHVAGALGMMAHWDLVGLARELPRLSTPLALVVGGNDRTISPTEAFRVRDLLPTAGVHYLKGLGHLAHEEQPREVADLVFKLTDESRATGGG